MTEQAVNEQTPLAAKAASPVWFGVMERLIPLVALVLIVIATAICERVKDHTSYFLTPDNLLNVLRMQAPVGVVALGMTFAIIIGGIDLSVGSMVVMAATVGVWLIQDHKGSESGAIFIGMLAMIGAGLALGLLNGLLIAKGRIAPFIATLGGYAAYRSIAQTIADNGTITVHNSYLSYLGSHGLRIPFLSVGERPLELHYASVVFILLAIIAGIILNRMRFGRYLYAIGGNERAAIYSAINVDRVKILTYTAVGICGGISAVLMAARTSSISSGDTGKLFELDAIAAVVIGGTRMSGGSGSIFGTVVGVLILGVIQNMLTFLDIPDTLQGVVKGVIIVGAVLVQRMAAARKISSIEEPKRMPRIKRALLGAVGLLTIGLSLTSCKQGDQTGATPGVKRMKIGISIPAADHGWTAGVNYWANQAKALHPEVDWILQTADSAAKQTDDIQTMLTRHVDGLVILAIQSDALTPIAEEAHKQGVYIVNVDRGFAKPGIADIFLEGDNKAFGRKSAEFICQKLGNKGDIVILEGMVATNVNKDRVEAAKAVFAQHPDIHILSDQPADWSRQKGLDLMQTFLTKNPHIDAVWAQDDDVALGAIQAIKEAHREKEMFVFGGAGMKDVIKMIMDHDPMVPADTTYPPSMIGAAIHLAASELRDGKVKELAPMMPRHLVLDVDVVTPDNAKDYYFPDSVY